MVIESELPINKDSTVPYRIVREIAFFRQRMRDSVRYWPEVLDSGDIKHPARPDITVPCAVMEYLEGRLLNYCLLNPIFNTPEMVLAVAMQLLHAIELAKDCDDIGGHFVLRGFKTQNIMIMRPGSNGIFVRLFDANTVANPRRRRLTPPGLVCCEVDTVAPEIAKRESMDQRSDVYAIGAIMYEMLAGHPVFTTDSGPETFYQHVCFPVPIISSPSIPDDVKNIVYRFLSKAPDDRPPDAASARNEVVELYRKLGFDMSPVTQYIGPAYQLEA
ncbi:MAG: protein kinase [Candidatus Peregrinibacteria bacterium]